MSFTVTFEYTIPSTSSFTFVDDALVYVNNQCLYVVRNGQATCVELEHYSIVGPYDDKSFMLIDDTGMSNLIDLEMNHIAYGDLSSTDFVNGSFIRTNKGYSMIDSMMDDTIHRFDVEGDAITVFGLDPPYASGSSVPTYYDADSGEYVLETVSSAIDRVDKKTGALATSLSSDSVIFQMLDSSLTIKLPCEGVMMVDRGCHYDGNDLNLAFQINEDEYRVYQARRQ